MPQRDRKLTVNLSRKTGELGANFRRFGILASHEASCASLKELTFAHERVSRKRRRHQAAAFASEVPFPGCALSFEIRTLRLLHLAEGALAAQLIQCRIVIDPGGAGKSGLAKRIGMLRVENLDVDLPVFLVGFWDIFSQGTADIPHRAPQNTLESRGNVDVE